KSVGAALGASTEIPVRAGRTSEVLEAGQVRQIGVGFLVATQQDDHLADDLNQFCATGLAQLVDQCLLGVAITDGDANLDQLLIVQGDIEFRQNTFAGTLLADYYHRLEMVANAFVGFLLFRAERHNDPCEFLYSMNVEKGN